MYRLHPFSPTIAVQRDADGAWIPCAPGNRDYAQFKADLAAGAELRHYDGALVGAEEVAVLLETLP